MLPHVHRVTGFDPADRDEHGRHTGAEDAAGDHGPVEAAYLRAVEAFAAEVGVDRLCVREPRLLDVAGLDGVLPTGSAGFHDGAEVSLDVAVALVRVMLRDGGVWCRLEVDGVFAVHVGRDLYVGADRPCTEAVARTRALGLFPERVARSPYEVEIGEDVQRPADDEFWAGVRWAVAMTRAGTLEEVYAEGASRWHELRRDTVDAVRAGLAPRARLAVWPPDPGFVDGPLSTAVLPDADGVVRARWRTVPTRGDRDWAFLKTLRRGQVVTGTVTLIAPFHVTFVDIGGFEAMINISELSWRPFDRPSDVVAEGEEVTAVILDVDPVRAHVPLSLKRLQEDPFPRLVERIGHPFAGRVVKVVPIGVFVRVEDREDAFVGLVPESERVDVRVGDPLLVTVVAVDVTRRRILLSRRRAVAEG
ncbi:S1 RNA-binding domain-containing protein [Actinosynnema sp. NPDC020468]|uniref:S1 RNA-binding domain-containing protein n=1 Tax=Actinosynnema sp. NPDC020468 TaxID=3154488 RepID=UPI0033D0D1A9